MDARWKMSGMTSAEGCLITHLGMLPVDGFAMNAIGHDGSGDGLMPKSYCTHFMEVIKPEINSVTHWR